MGREGVARRWSHSLHARRIAGIAEIYGEVKDFELEKLIIYN